MRMKRKLGRVAVTALALAAIAAATLPVGGFGADHLDGPSLLTSPAGRGDADINDVFVFEGRNESKTVIAVTTNPAPGVFSPATFGRDVLYQIKIDNTGDAVEDITYRVRFTKPFKRSGRQLYWVRKSTGASAQGDSGGRFVAIGFTDKTRGIRGGGKFFAGLRSDPFFFDLDGFVGTVEGVDNGRGLGDGLATDPFATFNTLAMVLEVKDGTLGEEIGVWATTSIREGGSWVQVDRMGRPAINTVLNSTGPIVGAPAGAKDAYNAAHPADDLANFGAGAIAALQALSAGDTEGSYDADQALALGMALLPDIVKYDTSTTAVGPLNGRQLADDVIDIELTIVTGGDPLGLFPLRDDVGAINGDDVGPHTDYLTKFPYLGEPHEG